MYHQNPGSSPSDWIFPPNAHPSLSHPCWTIPASQQPSSENQPRVPSLSTPTAHSQAPAPDERDVVASQYMSKLGGTIMQQHERNVESTSAFHTRQLLATEQHPLSAGDSRLPIRPSSSGFVQAQSMSNPYGVPITSSDGSRTRLMFNSLTSPTSDFAPFLDDFVPAASPTSEEERLAAAEEDKRRRNTAASARFRVKKKEREQALERRTTEMTEKVGKLEERVKQLEQENGWLRELITEKRQRDSKAGGVECDPKAAHDDDEDCRSPSEHTDGVGTRDFRQS